MGGQRRWNRNTQAHSLTHRTEAPGFECRLGSEDSERPGQRRMPALNHGGRALAGFPKHSIPPIVHTVEPSPAHTDPTAALHAIVHSYLSTLLAVAECLGSACPPVGGPYQHRLNRLGKRLAFDSSSE